VDMLARRLAVGRMYDGSRDTTGNVAEVASVTCAGDDVAVDETFVVMRETLVGVDDTVAVEFEGRTIPNSKLIRRSMISFVLAFCDVVRRVNRESGGNSRTKRGGETVIAWISGLVLRAPS